MTNDKLPNITGIGTGGRVRQACAALISYVNRASTRERQLAVQAFFTACAAAVVVRAAPGGGGGD